MIGISTRFLDEWGSVQNTIDRASFLLYKRGRGKL